MKPAALHPTTCLLSALLLLGPVSAAQAEDAMQARSKRVEVYDISQQFYDTRYGDTLSEILWQLLPNNPGKHTALAQEIIQLNPQAFINGDPNRLLAGKRLYLPGYLQKPDSQVDSGKYIIESYSWGNIKRPR